MERYQVELQSSIQYLRASRIEIDCTNHDTFIRILDAVRPILEEEAKELEEKYSKEEKIVKEN